MTEMNHFILSTCIYDHPMLKVKPKIRIPYLRVLKYFVLKISPDEELVKMRLNLYEKYFSEYVKRYPKQKSIEDDIATILANSKRKPWRKKYRIMLYLDIASLLLEKSKIMAAADLIKHYLEENKQEEFCGVANSILEEDYYDGELMGCPRILYTYYCKNRDHLKKHQHNYLVTADMSAGKSTLINALIGMRITRTSQEACTANVAYIYNKPFRDRIIDLLTDRWILDAKSDILKGINFERPSFISVGYNMLTENEIRICLVDTPGVNNSIEKGHVNITRQTIKHQEHTCLIYVLNINKLGTEEERTHLKWLAEVEDTEKIVFVLNQIDCCHSKEDDIRQSIEDLRNELSGIGFKNPVICPVSAYAALLAKMKMDGLLINEDDIDDYEVMKRKFNRSFYDLTSYYDISPLSDSEDEDKMLLQKCGFYGLENVLFGGTK